MSLVLVVLAAALTLGLLLGGRPGRLATLRLRGARLVALALLAQLLGDAATMSSRGYAIATTISAVLVLICLLRNRRLPGARLVAAGLLANVAVCLANGGPMPVSSQAAARAGADIDAVVLGQDPRHVLATSHTRLRWLGDSVPFPLPLRPQVLSAGDLLVAAGLGTLVLVVTTRDERGSRKRGARPLPSLHRQWQAAGSTRAPGARARPGVRVQAGEQP